MPDAAAPAVTASLATATSAVATILANSIAAADNSPKTPSKADKRKNVAGKPETPSKSKKRPNLDIDADADQVDEKEKRKRCDVSVCIRITAQIWKLIDCVIFQSPAESMNSDSRPGSAMDDQENTNEPLELGVK